MAPFDPFPCPMAPLVRAHGPLSYVDSTSYKPWLRDEFGVRCVYCLERERWALDRAASFSVDHVEARTTWNVNDYEKLVYSCTRCNSRKGTRVLPLHPVADPLGEHLRIGEDGTAIGLTPIGEKLIVIFSLNGALAFGNRRMALNVMKTRLAAPDDPVVLMIFMNWFSYPDDLPDLAALRPIGGNARPRGVANSHFARRTRRQLPETY